MGSGNSAGGSSVGRLVGVTALYVGARLVLVAALAAIIFFGAKIFGVTVPVIVALIFGLVVSMPLGLVLFGGLRRRVNGEIASAETVRRRDRADLRARLRGESDD